ncbi:uncharacterized protein LOC118745863 [Rhagoletis pomonella]|uniref:uncharacterized protein LOC118745863 n=1 Tax=Rhagoletis pomonella TaxID=28610 RepID=UPI00177A8971|nr:uncharacterized protein LOC118745863 [Rhagoletis pomonella]
MLFGFSLQILEDNEFTLPNASAPRSCLQQNGANEKWTRCRRSSSTESSVHFIKIFGAVLQNSAPTTSNWLDSQTQSASPASLSDMGANIISEEEIVPSTSEAKRRRE